MQNDSVRCPFAMSAALYAPDGRHNPEVFNCESDYRRHWPALIDVLNFYGVDLPVKDPHIAAHETIDASELGTSYVLLRIYRELDHFKRRLDRCDVPTGAMAHHEDVVAKNNALHISESRRKIMHVSSHRDSIRFHRIPSSSPAWISCNAGAEDADGQFAV